MDNTKSAVTLNWWPSLQDYNEAVQNPFACLQDPELQLGLPYTDALGLPRPVTGSFASVYRMSCAQKEYALRLFLRNLKDQADRYKLLSDFLQQNNLPYTAVFEFLSNGIKIRGEWMPALKMEWLQGVPLDDYIIENLANEQVLAQLTQIFAE